MSCSASTAPMGGVGVMAVLPGGVSLERVLFFVPQEQVVAVEFRRADDGNGVIHEVGIIDHPFEGLHAAHGDSHDCVEMLEAQCFCGETVLGADHVARSEGRETTGRGWVVEFEGEEETPSPRASMTTRKYFAGSTSCQRRRLVRRWLALLPLNQVGNEDGIGAIGVELAPGAVAKAASGDLLATSELADAEIGELLLPVRDGLLGAACD